MSTQEEHIVSVKSCLQFWNISETRVFTVKEWIIGTLLTKFSLHRNKDFQVLLQALKSSFFLNFASSHSQLPQAASPQARPVNFLWIDNTAMPRSASSLQMSMPFQQSSSKQLASKGTRFTEEETELLLTIWEEEFNCFTDKK